MNKGEAGSLYYPVSLDISGRECVVIGGGPVAYRKVSALLDCGASVAVISHDICPELGRLEEMGTVRMIRRDYVPGDLEKAFLAIAATGDSEINHKVAAESRKRRVLVNVVDDPDHSDFIVPSYLRRGDITIAVSTGGSSPALSRRIRTGLEKSFGEEYASLAVLIGEVRSELIKKGIKVDGDAWQKVLDLDSMVAMLQEGRQEEVKTVLLNQLEKAGRGEL
ncbi:bifunctional precorrin-2 dehydrogenase/sirohydrochlorin ferrochelatase [Chloroflexota bacterium]